MAKDKNYVSVLGWFGLLIHCAIPCIGWALAVILAFVGENETRKNFFKAKLLLIVLILTAVIGLYVFGFLAIAAKYLSDHQTSWPRFMRGE